MNNHLGVARWHIHAYFVIEWNGLAVLEKVLDHPNPMYGKRPVSHDPGHLGIGACSSWRSSSRRPG